MKLIHIFKAGTHTDMNGNTQKYTVADIEKIASQYNEQAVSEKHYAPLVVGHPATNAPAYGWVKKLIAKGSNLFAEPEKVNPDFMKLVNSGAYRTRSAAFYADGKLRHVGFLGAAPPAIKGLEDFSFAEDSDFAVFTMERLQNSKNEQNAKILRKIKMLLTKIPGVTVESVESLIPDYQVEDLGGKMEIEKIIEENKKLSADVAAYAEENKKLHEQIGEMQEKQKAAFFAEFEKKLVGKMSADEQEKAVKIAEKMYAENGIDGVSDFAAFVEAMPVIIPQEKNITANGVDSEYSESDEYAEYAEVDKARKDLNQKTKKIMKEKGLSYKEALAIAMQEVKQ